MEEHDDPTGLVYLRARQYDPDLGRFVGADPILGSLSSPQTQNRYAYVVNNPVKYTDPSGMTATAKLPDGLPLDSCAYQMRAWLNCMGNAWSDYESAVSEGGNWAICGALVVSNPGCGPAELDEMIRVTQAGGGMVSTALSPAESVLIFPIDMPVPRFRPPPVPGASRPTPRTVPARNRLGYAADGGDGLQGLANPGKATANPMELLNRGYRVADIGGGAVGRTSASSGGSLRVSFVDAGGNAIQYHSAHRFSSGFIEPAHYHFYRPAPGGGYIQVGKAFVGQTMPYWGP